MSWLVSAKQYIPAVIGEPWGGGYFAGYISHTADGNPTHALIVAPRETGATGTGYTLTTNRQWRTTNTATSGTDSVFDGSANTAAMVAAGIANFPAAQFCTGLSIGSFTDWYLPSRYELDIAYFNLKPGQDLNDTATGANPYSVPLRSGNRTGSYPMQTSISTFNTSAEAFVADIHWSSTQANNGAAWYGFNTGLYQDGRARNNTSRVRAFRRIAL